MAKIIGGLSLRDYQISGIEFVVNQRRGMIVLGVGKGKTEIALRSAEKLRCRTLIVCPKSLVKQWESLAKNRLPFFIIVAFSELERRFNEIKNFAADMCVVDEPKPLKSCTRVYELMLRIRPARRLVLDATPIENKLEEMWFLFRWLRPKLFGSLDNFRSKFIVSSRKYKNMSQFRELIAPHVFRPHTEAPRERKFHYIRVNSDFDFMAEAEYVNLCRRLYGLLKRARERKSIQAVRLGMGNISKLRSFLGDPNYGGVAKLRELLRLIQERPELRGVIFVYKRETAKMIARRLNSLGYITETFCGELSTTKREAMRKAFNEGTIQFLVATSAGERGLDLPTGNLIVHFDLPWTRAAYDQRDRVSRLSSEQSQHSLIVTLILRDTVEEVIWSIIAAKNRLMIEPFDTKSDTLIIHRKSWYEFLDNYLNTEEEMNGKVNHETGEGVWFSRGEGTHR